MTTENADPPMLSALTPVIFDRKQALEQKLAKLPTGDRSPLARLGTTHFARWSIIDPLEVKGRTRLDSTHYLLFTSWFDGSVEDYLNALCEQMPVEAEAIWANCVGHPGVANRDRFRSYLLEHRIEPGLPLGANKATVERVHTALTLKEEVGAFVLESRRLDDAELQRRWRARFPGDSQPGP